jgi:hypothetical protein
MAKREPKEPYVPFDQVFKGKQRAKFAALAREYRDAADKEKAAKAAKDTLGSALCAAMMGSGRTRIEVDNLWVRQQYNVNRRIDPKLLLKNGVTSDVIVKSTVETRTPYATVQVKTEDSSLVEE